MFWLIILIEENVVWFVDVLLNMNIGINICISFFYMYFMVEEN